MRILLEDYKRRLKNINELISKQRSNGSIVHQRREERLNTKAAECETFIVDIQHAITRQQQNHINNCGTRFIIPRILHFIDENGNNVDLNAEGVNVELKRDGTFEYYRSFGFAGRKELTPVYGA